MTDKIDGLSMNIEQTNQEKLRTVFPDCVHEGKVDIDKLLALLGEYDEKEFEKYKFEWNGKAECLRLAQQRSSGTLRPCPDESVNFDSTNNLYIEGDNLEVLKLLQTSYYRTVKMIYIDPPYNTGHDFVYEDNFADPLARYKEVTQQTTKSNPETMGRYHTNWLNMMYPRLRLAANLLRDDGVCFISIDDNEVHNLRKLCDEVFGEENFVAQFVWQHSIQPKGYLDTVSVHHNHILCYQKSSDYSLGSFERTEADNKAYSNPDNDPKGPWRSGDVRNALYRPNLIYDIVSPSGKVIKPCKNGWRWSKETVDSKIESGEIIFSKNEDRIIRKIYLSTLQGRVPESILFAKESGSTRDAMNELKMLFENPPFDTPKPTSLIKRLIKIANIEKYENAIILDFFSGSATTAHAVMQLNSEDGGNRQFILVQLPEVCDEKSEAHKAGYKNICEIGKERIRRAGHQVFPSCGGVAAESGRGGPETEQLTFRNTRNYMSLPYNPKLKDHARALRKAGNLSEVLFWNQVKNKQFKQMDFDRQKIIGNYIVDFYCVNCQVVIEIDGSSHDEKMEYDAERDAYLKGLGLSIIHIQDKDIKSNLAGVMEMLRTCSELNHPVRFADTPPQEGNVLAEEVKGRGLLDTGFKVFKLDSSNLKAWDGTPVEKSEQIMLLERMNGMIDNVKADRSDLDMVYEIMLKMGIPLDWQVEQVEINAGSPGGSKTAYAIGENCTLLICLQEGITADDVTAMCDYAPGKMVFAESCFADDTELANAHYILQDHELDLKLV